MNTKGRDNLENVAIGNKQDTKEFDGDRLSELIARELKARNRQDIALYYRGEPLENAKLGPPEIAKMNAPLHDNMANSLGHLINGNSPHFARSTKIQSR